MATGQIPGETTKKGRFGIAFKLTPVSEIMRQLMRMPITMLSLVNSMIFGSCLSLF